MVGSHLLMRLTASNDIVRAIHRENSDLDAVKKTFSWYLPEKEVESRFNKIEWQQADITEIPALELAFAGISKVYHCAALVSFDSSKAKALRKINIEGTANIVNLCVTFKISKLCYISSIATLSLNPGESYITEEYSWQPEKEHTDYAISKHGAEIEVWRGSQEGVTVVILNPGIILGPGNWDQGSLQIFKKVNSGLNYHFPKITGFVGVKDVAEAAEILMEAPIKNEQFIVVAENIPFRDVLNMIAESLEKPKPQKQLKPWMVYAGWIFQSLGSALFGTKQLINSGDYKSLFEDTFYSNRKIKEKLDFEFTPVKEVIQETGEIFRKDTATNR